MGEKAKVDEAWASILESLHAVGLEPQKVGEQRANAMVDAKVPDPFIAAAVINRWKEVSPVTFGGVPQGGSPFPISSFRSAFPGGIPQVGDGQNGPLARALLERLPHKFAAMGLQLSTAKLQELFDEASPYQVHEFGIAAREAAAAKPAGGSEFNRIPFIDRVFCSVFYQLDQPGGEGQLGLVIDRNTCDDSITSVNYKPDWWVNQTESLVAKGEEKKNLQAAINELTTKMLPFTADRMADIPYVVCYATDGERFRLFAIERANHKKAVPISKEYNLNNVDDRLCVFQSAVNIYRLLATFNTCGAFQSSAITPMYATLKQTPDCVVEVRGDKIKKVVKIDSSPHVDVRAVQDLYKRIADQRDADPCNRNKPNGLGNLVYGTTKHERDKDGSGWTLTLTLKPVGVHGRIPDTTNELAACARGVLCGLEILHRIGYAHCDVRLPNVVFLQEAGGEARWVLIDLELARPIGSKLGWHHPTMDPDVAPTGNGGRAGPCSVLSDLYALGKMVAHALVSVSDDSSVPRKLLVSFSSELVAHGHSSAAAALGSLEYRILHKEDMEIVQ